MTESSGNSRDDRRRGLPLEAASRITGLVTSVMDLHVRIALKEVDREKRRLIVGALLLGAGMVALLIAVLAAELALVLWLVLVQGWGWIQALLAWAAANLVLSGLLLRLGGQLTKGPYLPETMAGLMKTTRALVGR
ncbi:MAG: hypothetical protein RLZZ255_424 [Cyanobacteriota bacterium]|jgi:uncharacterized membrane protein YqjE